MKWFKKKKKKKKLTLDYIENKYNLKLTYPTQSLDIKTEDFDVDFYDELKSFGCSDIMFDRTWLHRDCWGGPQYETNFKTGKFKQTSKGRCHKCEFYPIKKKYDDEHNTKGIETDLIKAVHFIHQD